MIKLQNAIYRAAGGLLLAGSFGVFCLPSFAQSLSSTKAPASGTSAGVAKTAGPSAAKSDSSSKTKTVGSNAIKKAGSAATHSSTAGHGTTAAHNTGATHTANTTHTTSTTHNTSASAKKKNSAAKSTRVKAQTAPTPDRIMEIQAALAKAGAYDGDPTGKWDANTTAAMTKFQQSNGLAPSGKLDALTLQKLGLGSDTAGKGAPRPATPPTTTASSSSSGIRR